MYIKKLSLLNFRNIKNLNIELQNGVNIFYGDNAQGKTNILESIYMCATGRSQRTRVDSQLILFGERESHIRLFSQKDKRSDRIDVHIKSEGKKGIAVNGIPLKRSGDLFGSLPVVIFSPEDLQLIKSGPSERRRFMDMELCQLSSVYYYNLQQYYRVLKQRNNLLKEIQRKPSLRETIFVWDSQMLQYGKKIIDERKKFVSSLNEIASKKHSYITGGRESLEIQYRPNTEETAFEKKLEGHLDRDLFLGTTSVGPHKDDMSFLIDGYEAKVFASQGQQRTAALSAKLAEIDLIEAEKDDSPILLLDDVLSELDEKRQLFLLQNIGSIQTIITCTGIEDIIKSYVDFSFLFSVKNGLVEKI